MRTPRHSSRPRPQGTRCRRKAAQELTVVPLLYLRPEAESRVGVAGAGRPLLGRGVEGAVGRSQRRGRPRYQGSIIYIMSSSAWGSPQAPARAADRLTRARSVPAFNRSLVAPRTRHQLRSHGPTAPAAEAAWCGYRPPRGRLVGPQRAQCRPGFHRARQPAEARTPPTPVLRRRPLISFHHSGDHEVGGDKVDRIPGQLHDRRNRAGAGPSALSPGASRAPTGVAVASSPRWLHRSARDAATSARLS